MMTTILVEDEDTFFSKLDFFRISGIALTILVLSMLTLPEIIRAEDAKKPDSIQKIYSKEEAYRASGERDKKTFKIINPKIVLHYGKGIKFADNLAQVLRERGYPAVAYPGGPDGLVEIMVGRGIAKYKYDQRELNRGTTGGIAEDIFNARFGKPEKPQGNAVSTLSLE